MKAFKNGLITGLFLQLAIGPVFFFLINLTLQRTIFDGLVGALAVALVDFSYIALAILGIGKILEKRNVKKVFGIVSSLVLIIFGLFTIKGAMSLDFSTKTLISSTSLFSSFISVLFLTISNPLTIVLYTGILGVKGVEDDYTRKELFIFGWGAGSATFLFMSASVILMFFLKSTVPIVLIQMLNLAVGVLLIVYGGVRFKKVLTLPKTTNQ